MATTAEILSSLEPGMEAKLFADPLVMQTAKLGLTAFAVLCGLTAIYLFAKQLGGLRNARQNMFGWVGVALAGVAAFLLYDKAQAFQILDTNDPVITITRDALGYDTRRDGWNVAWKDIDHVELKTETRTPKQSVAQDTYEIRVQVKEDAHPQWKYDPAPENDMANVKTLFESSHYLVINPEPLGVGHSMLADALEKYRAGK